MFKETRRQGAIRKVMTGVLMAVMAISMMSCGAAQSSSSAEAVPVHQLSSEQQRKYDHYFLEAMVQRQKGNNDADDNVIPTDSKDKSSLCEVNYFKDCRAQNYGN